MDADELRRTWNDFFVAKQHTRVPSAGLIPHHPSAPMFTNSGMMQFVPYFLGEEAVPFDPPRAVSVQKCVRAGGKHNDLDAIGRSLRHLSFFEMLGNFSFGDYFKAEAIPWAWELVTEVLGIDADRVWVTIHHSDDEAHEIWADAVGFPVERIQRLGADNFWEMGEVGPCGPSSELFFDFGPDLGPEGGPENPAADQRYVEFWNLVFPQYYRGADGQLSDLAAKGIDTGAGFERLLGVLKGSPSLYAADSISRVVDAAQALTGRRLGDAEESDVALRLLADHARTMTFLIADGVIPSNEERGYVLRRIIRRAVRFAYLLGVESTVTVPLAGEVAEVMGGAYPEVARRPRRDPGRARARGGPVPAHAAQRPRHPRGRDGRPGRRRRAVRPRGLHPPRHLRLPLRGHRRDLRGPGPPRRPGHLRRRHAGAAPPVEGRRSEEQGGRGRRRPVHLPGDPGRARPHRLHRPRRGDHRRDRRRGRGRRRRRWRGRRRARPHPLLRRVRWSGRRHRHPHRPRRLRRRARHHQRRPRPHPPSGPRSATPSPRSATR